MTGLLLDHLWQSTLFAAAAGLLALALGRNAAAVRYWVWFAAAAKFLVPFALLVWAAGQLATHLHAQTAAPPRLELARRVLEPMTTPVAARMVGSLGRAPLDIGPWLAFAWVLGSAAVLWRRATQWRALRKALAEATPMTVPAGLPAVMARAQGGPAVIGFVRPVLVLPEGLTERLTPAELEAVLEHELCHARRRDNLLTLPLLLTQVLFWFHPLVWWIGRRLLAERERACDEAVLGGGTDAETYARALLEACRLQVEPAPILTAAATGGANLKRRIRRIMAEHSPRPLGASGRAMLTAAATAALALPVAAGVYTAAPAATARVLAGLTRSIVAAVAPIPPSKPAGRKRQAIFKPSAPPEPAAIRLISAPAVLTEITAYAPEAKHSIRLAYRAAVPVFQAAESEPSAAVAAKPADYARPAADAEFLRALAERVAYVKGVDLGGARLDLRSAGGCPTSGVIDAEGRLGGEAVSTAFDGRVRRFIDEALAGEVEARNLTPAMARAVENGLPALQQALAARFSGSGGARLIGEDRAGHDVYLVRPGGAGYALVLVDDAGLIDGALFCAAG